MSTLPLHDFILSQGIPQRGDSRIFWMMQHHSCPPGYYLHFFFSHNESQLQRDQDVSLVLPRKTIMGQYQILALSIYKQIYPRTSQERHIHSLTGRGGERGMEGAHTGFSVAQLFSLVPHMPNTKKLGNSAYLSPQSPAQQNRNERPVPTSPLLLEAKVGKGRKRYDDDSMIIYLVVTMCQVVN